MYTLKLVLGCIGVVCLFLLSVMPNPIFYYLMLACAGIIGVILLIERKNRRKNLRGK